MNDAITQRIPEQNLEASIQALNMQLRLLNARKEDERIRMAKDGLELCIQTLGQILEADHLEPMENPPVPVRPKPGKSPYSYKIGVMARAALPVIFERGEVTEKDIEYLLSDQAIHDFVKKRIPFIKEVVTGDPSECKDRSGRVRYYSINSICLPFHDKSYYLTRDLEDKGKKFDNLLAWILGHGIEKRELVELCRNYVEDMERQRKKIDRTGSPSPKSRNQQGKKKPVFPYQTSFVAQVAFPELFRRGLINQKDIQYLQSKSATDSFFDSDFPVIRKYVSGEPAEYQDETGRRRYYPLDLVCLEFYGERYYLCSQWINHMFKFQNLLQWIKERGLSEKELIEICRKRNHEEEADSTTPEEIEEGKQGKKEKREKKKPVSNPNPSHKNTMTQYATEISEILHDLNDSIAFFTKKGKSRFEDFMAIWYEQYHRQPYWSELSIQLENAFVDAWDLYQELERIDKEERTRILNAFGVFEINKLPGE